VNGVRLSLPAGGFVLVAVLSATVLAGSQPVEPMNPEAEQQVEILRPGVAQSVDEVARQPEQQIGVPEPVSSTKRAASTAGKVVLGVAAAGVAVGAAILSLLFL
jgi:hypothetical protein